MKWIKASERLPDSQGYYFVKTGRNRKEVYSWKNEEHSANTWEYEVIEWLDESPSTEVKGQQGYWEQRCKSLESVLEISRSLGFARLEVYGKQTDEWNKHYEKWQQLKSSQPNPPQEGQDELWREFFSDIGNAHKLAKLKSKFTLIKK